MNAASRFLLLPLEIRHKIYEFHFDGTTILIHPATIVIESKRARTMHAPSTDGNGNGNSNLHPVLAILQVCKQIAEEAEPFFFRYVKFEIDIMMRRPFVPVAKLYKMKRFAGGAEVRQLLEIDEFRDWTLMKHCIMGPFEPERIQAKELDLMPWASSPLLQFMIDEANLQTSHVDLHMHFSNYSHWIY